MPSLKDPTTRYATVLIAIICIWIYVAIVNETQKLLDIPIYVLALVLLISVTVAHKLLLKSGIDKSKLDKAGSNPRTFFKIFIGTVAAAVTAIALALLTTALVDADYRSELSSPFVTCAKDESMIKSVPVGKSAVLDDGSKLTVHNVAYNIPQKSDRPQENNSWRCAKATAVEVSVENSTDTSSRNAVSISDLKLKAVPPHSSTNSSLIGSESEDELYQTNLLGGESFSMLKLKFLPERATSSRGWLVFSVAENSNNDSSEFTFTKSGQTLVSIPLPN